MQSKFFALSGLTGAFVVASAASAAFTGISWSEVDSAALGWDAAGYDPAALDTYRVYAAFDDNLGLVTGVGDIQDEIDFSLTSTDGAFWNSTNAGAGDLPPNPGFFPVFADLQWDTFVTIGAAAEETPVTNAAPGFSSQAMGLAGDFILDDTGWFASGFPEQGNAVDGKVLIAQITVAAGVGVDGRNWRVSGLAEQGNGESAYDMFADFSIPAIPAPGVLALLGVAGLVSTRRRR